MQTLIYILYAFLGVLIGSLLSILPGMHILNFVGIGVFINIAFGIEPLALVMIFIGMLISYIVIGMIQMTYMGVPDDSTRYFAFPNQKYLMHGRGHEAAIISGIGVLGAALLLLALGPFSSAIFPIFRRLTTPHIHWILIGVVAYLLQAEWPKDWGSRAKTRLGRLKDGWASLSAGWLTFFLSMMLGFIILNVSILPVDHAFQNMMAVVVGFFGVSYVLMNMISRVKIPPQNIGNNLYVSKKDMVRGTTTGFLGGMFAGFEPMITAGPGLKIASHATTASGDTQFMISGGAGRFAYYIGAFFLLWIPLLHLTRGLTAWISGVMYQPKVESEFWLLLSGIAMATVFAFALLFVFSRMIARVIPRVNFHRLSLAILSVIIGLVWGFAASPGYDPLLLLAAIFSSAAVLLAMFVTLSKAIVKVRTRGSYLPFIVLLIGFFLVFICLNVLLVGYDGLANGARAMVILTTATGIGLIPLTFRTMWTNTLLGYFFPVMLNMAGLSAGIVVALGVA